MNDSNNFLINFVLLCFSFLVIIGFVVVDLSFQIDFLENKIKDIKKINSVCEVEEDYIKEINVIGDVVND